MAEASELLKEEKKKNELVNDKIKSMKDSQARDRLNMINQIREDVHIDFLRKMRRVEEVYREELSHLKNAFYQAQLESKAKDDLIRHFTDIIRDLDMTIAEFKLKTKQDIDGKIELADFRSFSFRMPSTKPKLEVHYKNYKTPLERKNKDLEKQNRLLESELQILKEQHEEILEKWKSGLLKINYLEQDIRNLNKSHDETIKKMGESTLKNELKLKKEVARLKSYNK